MTSSRLVIPWGLFRNYIHLLCFPSVFKEGLTPPPPAPARPSSHGRDGKHSYLMLTESSPGRPLYTAIIKTPSANPTMIRGLDTGGIIYVSVHIHTYCTHTRVPTRAWYTVLVLPPRLTYKGLVPHPLSLVSLLTRA